MRGQNYVDPRISTEDCVSALHQFFYANPNLFQLLFIRASQQFIDIDIFFNEHNTNPFAALRDEDEKQFCQETLAIMCNRLNRNPSLLDTYLEHVQQEARAINQVPDENERPTNFNWTR